MLNVKKKTNKNLQEQSYLFGIDKKEHFLSGIKSPPSKLKHRRYKYSRVVTSPIRYPGGKSLGVGYVIELLPNNINKVISPFFGGGSIEIAMSKYLGMEVIGYDIFDILVNYWQVQIESSELLYERLKELKPDQETYAEIKNKLTDHWDKITKTFEEWSQSCKGFKRYKTINENDMHKEWLSKQVLNKIDLAVYYYFNYNLSYGPGFLGWASKVYLNNKKYKSMLRSVRSFSPGSLKVECADFQEVFKKYPNDFFYCDPPYYIGESSKMFKGIYPMRNIPIHHDGFKHSVLAKLLNEHKGGFILSYNDCDQVKSWYKDFDHYFPTWQYTMGQGETRIGNNRNVHGNDHVKKSHEILIAKLPEV
jgi:DNA adenine methylase